MLRSCQDPDPWFLREAEARFNLFASPGEPFIDASLVQADIDKLDALIGSVNAYTTKNLAHRDDITRPGVTTPPVTWGELDAAIDIIGVIHKKYYKLRNPGKSLGGLTPLLPPGWVQMFGTAWMPPGFMLPEVADFDPVCE